MQGFYNTDFWILMHMAKKGAHQTTATTTEIAKHIQQGNMQKCIHIYKNIILIL